MKRTKQNSQEDLDFLVFGDEEQLFTSEIYSIDKVGLQIQMRNGDVWNVTNSEDLVDIFEKKLKYELYCASNRVTDFETLEHKISEIATRKAQELVEPYIKEIESNTAKFEGLMKKVVFDYQTFENQLDKKSKVIEQFDFKKLEDTVEQITKITEKFNVLLS